MRETGGAIKIYKLLIPVRSWGVPLPAILNFAVAIMRAMGAEFHPASDGATGSDTAKKA